MTLSAKCGGITQRSSSYLLHYWMVQPGPFGQGRVGLHFYAGGLAVQDQLPALQRKVVAVQRQQGG